LSDGRFQALINRLRNSSLILVDNIVREFRKSSFRPTFFEYKIGGKDSALAPLEFNLESGNKISVYGTIDRVDTFRNGADAFVRVVDYKTGSTEHLISNVKYGIDTQMLLYLFSITKGSPDKFIKDAALDGATNVYPAGVLYQPAKPKLENTVMPESEETALPLSDKNLRRNGIVLNDIDIISAMENDIAGKFIPVKLSKDSLKSGSDVLVDPEGFDKLLESIEQTFKRIGDKMLDGNGCASPLNVGSIKACKYCNFASICRSKTEISEEEGGESNGN
jgi:ATP-dependent helicase/nuclease subunit B